MARQRFGRGTTVKLVGGSLWLNFPGAGRKQLRYRATEIQALSTDMRPVFEDFGDHMLAEIDRQFQVEGDPKWQPLARATVRDKLLNGYGHSGTLQRTGRLRRNFRKIVTPRTLRLENRVVVNGVPLFDIHQNGTATIPKRPLIRLTGNREVLTRTTREYLEGD